MKRLTKITLGGAMLAIGAFALMPKAHALLAEATDSFAQKDKNELKSLSGLVVGQDEVPLPQSVVYLKNMKTLAVKSFIADDSGAFHFYALSPNTDYQVYAEFNGQRSGAKTVSAFDSKTKVEMTLKIDVKK